MSAAPEAPVSRPPLSEEDLGRRNWYLLLARLFRSPPEADTLAAIAAARPRATPVNEPPLVLALAELADACAHADPRSVRQEFDQTFLGVGKAEVFLNACWYLSGFLHDRTLVELRETLAGLGFARPGEIGDTEDHFAALCETMALLIESNDPRVASLDTQRDFFRRFLAPWFESLCEAIEHSGNTDFYKHAARAAQAFLAIERQAFDFE